MILIVPALCFVIPMAVAGLALRYGAGWISAALVAGSLIGFAMASAGAQSPGFEAIDDEIFAALIFGPAFLGSLVGAAFGWWKWRRT